MDSLSSKIVKIELHCSPKSQTDLQAGLKGTNKKEKAYQQVMSIYLNENASHPEDKAFILCLRNIQMVSYFAISAYLTCKIQHLLQKTSSFVYKTVH